MLAKIDHNTELQVITVANPFDRRHKQVSAVRYKGQTIEQLRCTNFPNDIEVAACVNGLLVRRQLWASYRLRPGDQLVLSPMLSGGGGGGDGKMVLNIAIMVVIAIYAGPMAARMFGQTMVFTTAGALTTFGMFAAAGIMAGGAILVNTLMPAPRAGKSSSSLVNPAGTNDSETSQSFGWNPTSLQQQGLAVPRFYGRNKLNGNVIAAHRELTGEETNIQRLFTLVCLGDGPIKSVTNVKLNDRVIDNFEDTTFEIRLGATDQPVTQAFTKTKWESTPNIIVKNGDPIVFRTVHGDFNELEVDITFPGGLYNLTSVQHPAPHDVIVTVEIKHTSDDADYVKIADSVTITDDILKQVTRTFIGTDLVKGERYWIRVTKETAESNSISIGENMFLGAVREVLTDKLQYPRRAMVALSAKATDQLSGSLRFSCIVQGMYVRVYDDATETWSIKYSNNPAWILADLLTQPVYNSTQIILPQLMLHFDGVDEQTWTRDSSIVGHTVNMVNEAELDTTAKKFGTSSLILDGDNDSVRLPNSADWNLCADATTDFNIDFWFKMDVHGTGRSEYLISNFQDLNHYWALWHLDSSGANNEGLAFDMVWFGINEITTGHSNEITDTDWHHIALVKIGTEYGVYLDGTQVLFVDDDSNRIFDGFLYIGERGDGSNLDGHIDEVRVQKTNHFGAAPVVGLTDTITVPTSQLTDDHITIDSVARYNGIDPTRLDLDAFTVLADFSDDLIDIDIQSSVIKSTKLLLHLNGEDGDTSAVDSSASNHTITFNGNAAISTEAQRFGNASVVLDGTGDFLSAPDHSDWEIFGSLSDDFTIDIQVKHRVASTRGSYLGQFVDGTHWWFLSNRQAAPEGIMFNARDGALPYTILLRSSQANKIDDTDWHRLTLCKVANEWGLYKDGTQIAYATQVGTPTFSAALTIGANNEAGGAQVYFDGNVDEVYFKNTNTFDAEPAADLSDTLEPLTGPHSPESENLEIAFITQQNTATVTFNSALSNIEIGDKVRFTDVTTMTEINDEVGEIVYIPDEKTIVVDIDSTGFTPFASGTGTIQGVEPRITFDGIFDTTMTLWDAAMQVCESARCILVWNGTELTVAVNKAYDPAVGAVQMFSLGNITQGSFSERFLPQIDRASEIQINYRDREDQYSRTPYSAFDVSVTDATKRIVIDDPGATRKTQVVRLANLRLLENQLIKRTVSWGSNIEAIACTIGDVVNVQHDVPNWGGVGSGDDKLPGGGRVLAFDNRDATDDVVTIDADLTALISGGVTWQMMVRCANDVMETVTILSIKSLENNIMALWALNDNDSNTTVLDTSGHGNTGTLIGDDDTEDKIGSKRSGPKRTHNFFTLNGTDDLVDCGNNPNLQITDDLSVFIWMKTSTTAAAPHVLMSKYDHVGGELSWLLLLASNHIYQIVLSDDGTFDAGHFKSFVGIAKGSLSDDEWHLVGFTFDASRSALLPYVDGFIDATVTKSTDNPITSLHNSTANVAIGARYSTGAGVNLFPGALALARIYNKIVTTDEALNLWLDKPDIMAGRSEVTIDGKFTDCMPMLDDLWAIGKQNLVTKEYRVVGLERSVDNDIAITGVEYIPAVYADD